MTIKAPASSASQVGNRAERSQNQEEAFCEAWIHPLDLQRVRLSYLYSLVFQVFLLGTEPFVEAYTHLVPAARAIHAMSLPLLILGFLRRKNFVVFRRVLWAISLIFVISLDVLLVHTAKNWLTHTDMLIVFAFHIITGTFFPHADRIPPWFLYLGLSLHIAALWIAFAPIPMGFVIASASTFCYVFSATIALSIQRTEAQIARVEYQFRTTIVPEHIVRHSVSSTLDLSELFKPSLKFCACLSSDWRNYQAISSRVPATQLTHSLNTYHQWAQNLAREFFPRGNYYTDWIADELFLVVYAEYPGDERDVVNQVVAFAHELLKVRPEFTRIHGIPKGVDVGISAGSALVGVMGPDSHRKATALGEIPGIARRLQTLGKNLRQIFGQKDRVIFSRDILMLLNQPLDISAHTVDESQATNDLRDLEVYYIAVDESPTQKDPKSA
jgi:hypothetical protein